MTEAGEPAEIKSLSFEQALEELETIVRKLEQGEVDLDQSIAAYERGAQLKAHCEAKLREAQAKVDRITQAADGSLSVETTDLS
ncbi:MAG: exodeoxyribonuclease VII small subunit [Pseudomonadota bacterium]